MLRKSLGIDIGTTQTTICSTESGILLQEPTVAAIDADTEDVLEAGAAALRLAVEQQGRVTLCYPVWDTVVKSAGVLAAILRIFMRRALGRTVLRPHVLVSIPCDLTESQENAVEDAVLAAGAGKVHLLEAPLCAALGVGFDFSAPTGQMLVHMGAARTEAAMIFLGDMVTHVSVPVGGKRFDSAISRYVRSKHGIQIGTRTAEQIKLRIGELSNTEQPQEISVKGRVIGGKATRVVTLSSREILTALKEPLTDVLDAIVSVVEQTGDDMRADISKSGLVLTGGAILQGMDQFLADVMGLRTKRAPNAATAAAEGAALALQRLEK